jgi:hypothetical protein
MAIHQGKLFVQLRRSLDPPLLAVVDLQTEELVDVDPQQPGIQAIELVGTFPQRAMQIDPSGTRLLLSATGEFFDEGGIEMVDLATFQSLGFAVSEASKLTGVDVNAFVLTTPDFGYYLYSTDFGLSSHLHTFTISGGPDDGPDLQTTVGYFVPVLIFEPAANVVFWPEGVTPLGVHVFDASTGERLTRQPTPTGGPPTDLVLVIVSSGNFLRADCNEDSVFDVADPIRSLAIIFSGAPGPVCADSCDTNDDGEHDISDAVYALSSLFALGPPPPAPYPDCGEDPTADALACTVSSPGCR